LQLSSTPHTTLLLLLFFDWGVTLWLGRKGRDGEGPSPVLFSVQLFCLRVCYYYRLPLLPLDRSSVHYVFVFRKVSIY